MAKIYYFLGHEQYHPERLVNDGVLAEKYGFDGLFISEHLNPWVDDVGASGFALATLGALAVKTNKIKLMTGVISPLFRYHPAIVAQAAATIDRLSNGRFILGIGNGEAINEVPLGFEFPNYKERSMRLIEALTIIKKLLNNEKLNFEGQYYKTNKVKLYSPSINNIPIFVAAAGIKSAILAAEYANGIIISVKDLEYSLENIINPFKQKSQELSRLDLLVLASLWSVYAKNKKDALIGLKPWRGLRSPNRDKATDPMQLQNDADLLNPQDILSRYTLVKSPEDYINAYSPLITKLNANIVVIQTTTNGNQQKLIEMLGKRVVPVLKNL